MASLTVADDEPDLAQRAAARLTTAIGEAIAARGSAVVSLTGGSTPRRLYSLLSDRSQPWAGRIDWPRVHVFWGDERHVPPDHPDSNFGMAARALLEHVPIPAAQVHRMHGEIADAAEAARRYAQELDAGFEAAGRSDRTFDVMLLGLGEDAHIASIFPGSELLERRPVKGRPTQVPADAGRGFTTKALWDVGRGFMPRHDQRRVAAIWAPHLDAWRITLTPDAILDARAIVMLVSGAIKASAVHAAIEARRDVVRWPAQLLRDAADRVEWMADRAAASQLGR